MADKTDVASERRYFVRWRGKVSGPIGFSRLQEQLATGQISKHHQVSSDRRRWVTISEHEDFVGHCVRNAPGTAEIGGEAQREDSEGRRRLRLRDDSLETEDSAVDRWYYVEAGEVTGPVSLDDVRRMVVSGRLPSDVPVCKEGGEAWQPATEFLSQAHSESIESRSAAETTEPAPEPPDALAGEERVCLHCGRIYRAAGTFCQQCGARLGTESKEYGGIGRLAYVGCLFGLGFLQAILSTAVATVEGESVLALVFAVFQLVPVIFRLQNIGMSGWWSLLMFVPIANLLIGVYCLAYPEGYQDTKELDTAAKVIIGTIVGLLVLGLIVVLIAVFTSL